MEFHRPLRTPLDSTGIPSVWTIEESTEAAARRTSDVNCESASTAYETVATSRGRASRCSSNAERRHTRITNVSPGGVQRSSAARSIPSIAFSAYGLRTSGVPE